MSKVTLEKDTANKFGWFVMVDGRCVAWRFTRRGARIVAKRCLKNPEVVELS